MGWALTGGFSGSNSVATVGCREPDPYSVHTYGPPHWMPARVSVTDAGGNSRWAKQPEHASLPAAWGVILASCAVLGVATAAVNKRLTMAHLLCFTPSSSCSCVYKSTGARPPQSALVG